MSEVADFRRPDSERWGKDDGSQNRKANLREKKGQEVGGENYMMFICLIDGGFSPVTGVMFGTRRVGFFSGPNCVTGDARA